MILTMATIKISVTVDVNTLKEFDDVIGLVPRSTYINSMMKKEVERLTEQE